MIKAKQYLKEFKEKHGIPNSYTWSARELTKLMEGYDNSKSSDNKKEISRLAPSRYVCTADEDTGYCAHESFPRLCNYTGQCNSKEFVE
jgi:hypothetical protein